MLHYRALTKSFVLVGLSLCGASAYAEPVWTSFIPFQRIDADPNKTYELTEDHGPWMILAATFMEGDSEQLAHELVLELRKRFKMKAYVHYRDYDQTNQVQGLGVDKIGRQKVMRYANNTRFTGTAVLVGNFDSINDPKLKTTLNELKYASPHCLAGDSGQWTTNRMNAIRRWAKLGFAKEEIEKKGPMGAAFATRNALLPAEVFSCAGVEKFVAEMNEDVKYSLLDNRYKYTVKIATFSGTSTISKDEIDAFRNRKKMESRLADAAMKAHRLTLALRKQRVEAYEFHDRHESIVTVGGFVDIRTQGLGGRVTTDPRVLQVMEYFGTQRKEVPGESLPRFQPREFVKGILCDTQPVPILVPRKSIGSDYARR